MAENYNDIPMSDESKKDMSFTPSDQLFLKRCFDRQDSVIEEFISKTYDEHAKIIIGVVRDIIAEQNGAIFKKIDEQNKVIKKIQGLLATIQEELRDHDVRLKKLETRVGKLFIEHEHNHQT